MGKMLTSLVAGEKVDATIQQYADLWREASTTIPLFLNDTKTARGRDQVAKMELLFDEILCQDDLSQEKEAKIAERERAANFKYGFDRLSDMINTWQRLENRIVMFADDKLEKKKK